MSLADFGAAKSLAARGFDAEAIRGAIRAASPNLDHRKPGHVEDYTERTIAAAMPALERERRQNSPPDQKLEP